MCSFARLVVGFRRSLCAVSHQEFCNSANTVGLIGFHITIVLTCLSSNPVNRKSSCWWSRSIRQPPRATWPLGFRIFPRPSDRSSLSTTASPPKTFRYWWTVTAMTYDAPFAFVHTVRSDLQSYTHAHIDRGVKHARWKPACRLSFINLVNFIAHLNDPTAIHVQHHLYVDAITRNEWRPFQSAPFHDLCIVRKWTLGTRQSLWTWIMHQPNTSKASKVWERRVQDARRMWAWLFITS